MAMASTLSPKTIRAQEVHDCYWVRDRSFDQAIPLLGHLYARALGLLWDYGDVGFVGFFIRDNPIHEGENRIVFPETNVFAWMPLRSCLAHDDASGSYELSHGRLDAEAL